MLRNLCDDLANRFFNFRPSRSRPNGTQTFRRTSQANVTGHHRDDPSQGASSGASGVYVPPHMASNFQSSARTSSSTDSRYSKQQLLDLYQAYSAPQNGTRPLEEILTEGWNPGSTHTASSSSSWGRREDTKDAPIGPDICWDQEGSVQPLGLEEMDEEEKEVNNPKFMSAFY